MKKIFKNKNGAALAASATILSSTAAGTASVVTAAAGDNVMAWIMLFINAAILISNAALEIYKKWRDKDKEPIFDDKSEKKDDEKEDGEK